MPSLWDQLSHLYTDWKLLDEKIEISKPIPDHLHTKLAWIAGKKGAQKKIPEMRSFCQIVEEGPIRQCDDSALKSRRYKGREPVLRPPKIEGSVEVIDLLKVKPL